MAMRVKVMSDLFILYAVFCYLFHLGLLIDGWEVVGNAEKIGGIVGLTIAPILVPFSLGLCYKD